MSVPADRHEWLSFEDPGEDRTWMFDVTFLMSSWTCIYGRGCQGVLTGPAAEYEQGCCSYGAHFIDDADVKSTEAFAARLTKQQWQFKSKGAKGIVNVDKDGTRTTKLVDDACIFLNRPGFEGGAGCALHQAAVASGERPLDWKPDVCWQLPLRLIDQVDEHGHVTSTLREWKRRDWGDGGAEFHWWCTEAPDAFVGDQPVYLELRDEIIEMTSEVAYDLLTKELKARRRKTLLPHPAVRR